MKQAIIVSVILATAGIAGTVSAAPTSCKNAESQFDLNRCAGIDYKAADGKLNQSYRQALARLSTPSQGRLREAQRSWIVFRDKQCAFESNGDDGGSVAPMVAANCATGLTLDRAKILAETGKCVEGDVSCAR